MEKLQDRKFIVCFLCSGILFIFLLCKALSWYEMRIIPINVDSYSMIGADDGVEYYLDYAYFENNNNKSNSIVIAGWCVILGKQTNPIAIHVLLKDESNNYYQLPTSMEQRAEVTKHFDDNVNYDNSGFSVNIDTSFFNFNEEQYEIVLLYEQNMQKSLVYSGKIISQPEKD